MRLELGTPVRCEDAMLGELADVVIDPAKRRVTHIVVQPRHSETLIGARMLPVELIEPGDVQQVIALRCTTEDVGRLAPVQGFVYEGVEGLPVDDPNWDVGVADVLGVPFYAPGELGAGSYTGAVAMAYDRIPKDDVELRRSSPVRSSDGYDLGHVEALIVDANDKVTHFELQHRRLWARYNIQLPIAAIQKIDTDVVTVALSREQVRALPAERARRS